jgi:hypothetical protein
MSEQLYGIEETERSQGWERMPLANPIPKETFDDTSAPAPDQYTPLSPKEAAEALADERNRPVMPDEAPVPEEPAIVREYTHQRGEHSGEPMDLRQTVSAEQAAHDLFLAREQDALATKTAADAELQQVVDQLRGDQQQQPVAPEHQSKATVDAAAQAELAAVEQAASGDDEVARALQNPRVLAAVEQQVSQYQQQAEQARQTYEQAVLQNANVTLANISARYPELRNVGLDQWPTVLQTLQTSNPQRFQQISQELQGTRENLTQAAQVMARQQQDYQAQLRQSATRAVENFNRFGADADASFDEFAKREGISGAHLKEIRSEALTMLRESGMTDQQIAEAWNSDFRFRSFPAQQTMMWAALYRMGRRGLAQKVAPKVVPPVQRPGVSGQFVDAKDYSTQQLSARLTHSGSLKDATALLQARRQNKR